MKWIVVISQGSHTPFSKTINIDDHHARALAYPHRIVLPERTFYLVAPSPNNRDEWLDILQFKLVSVFIISKEME